MAPTLLYLLKANVALLLFAAAYFGLLRRLTFFTLNRFYLLFALVFSAAYPVLPLPALFPEAASLPVAFTVLAATGGPGEVAPVAAAAAPINWEAGGLVLYAGGAAVLLVRLVVQLLSLWRVRRGAQAAVLHGQAVRTLAGAVSPFSFWRTIYLNPARHPAPELAAVLRHEQVHVQQWHTLDVLLAQVAQALAWCNPAAWLLRRALLDNLEYLADHAALQTGLDRRAYQYSLLRLSHGAAGPSLVSHFTFPTLKNRVAMMNTPHSSTGQLARYIVAGPLVLALALAFSATQAQGAGPVVPATTRAASDSAAPPTLLYCVDGQLTNELVGGDAFFVGIATMKVLRGSQVQQVLGKDIRANEVYVITTNKNSSSADVVALNKKVDAAGAQDMHLKVKLGPAVDPAKHQLPAGIKAYIAKTYPNAKLVSWAISEKPSAKAPFIKYLAAVKEDDRRVQLYFNAAEQPVQVAKPTSQRQEPVSATEAVVSKALTTSLSQAAGIPPIIYVDGKRTTTDINAISPNNIASINVLKGERARQLAGDAGAEGVMLITTKENQDAPEVRAFNAKYGAAAPAPAVAETPKSVAYLAPDALLYITKTYPGARLLGVSEVPGVNGGAPRYQAEIVLGRRPGYLLFDAQGKFISDSYTSNAR